MTNDEKKGSNNIRECEELGIMQQDISSETMDCSGYRPEKRTRNDSDEQDATENNETAGFTLVQRKKKSIARQKVLEDFSAIEVCVTSDKMLPKQIGFAKLLNERNITNIIQIKYKSSYKLTLKFESKNDAEKLLNDTKFENLGYRCRLTNEVNLVYGVVKYIELEVTEEELSKSFKSDSEIISVKRLKRLNDGEWIDSETVRFCFKSNVLPSYIYGYDCRFKVDPYTFPVTQCSVCWKYGHLSRVCPLKKPLCPKCAGDHHTCDTVTYKCINCKGEHMAFYKKCPVFLKEKEIRRIMCKETCTYKIALSKYLEGKKDREKYIGPEILFSQSQVETNEIALHTPINIGTEPQVDNSKDLGSESDGHAESEDITRSSEEDIQKHVIVYEEMDNRKRRKVKKKKVITNNKLQVTGKINALINRKTASPVNKKSEIDRKEDRTRQNKEENNGSDHKDIWRRIKMLFFTDITLEQKFIQACKILFEGIRAFFIRTMCDIDTESQEVQLRMTLRDNLPSDSNNSSNNRISDVSTGNDSVSSKSTGRFFSFNSAINPLSRNSSGGVVSYFGTLQNSPKRRNKRQVRKSEVGTQASGTQSQWYTTHAQNGTTSPATSLYSPTPASPACTPSPAPAPACASTPLPADTPTASPLRELRQELVTERPLRADVERERRLSQRTSLLTSSSAPPSNRDSMGTTDSNQDEEEPPPLPKKYSHRSMDLDNDSNNNTNSNNNSTNNGDAPVPARYNYDTVWSPRGSFLYTSLAHKKSSDKAPTPPPKKKHAQS